jgi:hypothetical protein
MRVLKKRRAVIEWAGELRAYPLVRREAPNEVKLVVPGEDESGWSRVGWRQFFTPLEKQKIFVVAESESELRYRLVPAHEAHGVLPTDAFGLPWWKTLARNVCVAWPHPAHNP